MSHLATFSIRACLLAIACALPSACDPAPTAPATASPDDAVLAFAPGASGNAEVRRGLARLRATLAPFHRFEAARAAGYDAQITPCMELPGTGGMGFHYGNPALIDGVVDALEPEILLYVPERNGRMRLLAVEYIVPFDAWTAADPPSLYGQTFAPNEAFGVWALHAWVWHHNPAGMFADWNPRVSCVNAP
jgi:hypothetical protein